MYRYRYLPCAVTHFWFCRFSSVRNLSDVYSMVFVFNSVTILCETGLCYGFVIHFFPLYVLHGQPYCSLRSTPSTGKNRGKCVVVLLVDGTPETLHKTNTVNITRELLDKSSSGSCSFVPTKDVPCCEKSALYADLSSLAIDQSDHSRSFIC